MPHVWHPSTALGLRHALMLHALRLLTWPRRCCTPPPPVSMFGEGCTTDDAALADLPTAAD
eukprot:4570299-Prymnesium_polylepis.1